MDKKLIHEEYTSMIIRAFYNVYNKLGFGFLEKVYERSLIIELRDMGMFVEPQFPIKVHYKNEDVGYYIADLLVEKEVIVELKAVESLCDEHFAVLINYLKATDKEVGLILNFGKKPEFKRKVLTKNFR